MKTSAFSFTKSGLLTPAIGIETSLEAMEAFFVHGFPKSENRPPIFENFQQYLSRLQSEVFPWFEQWVDGAL